MSSLRLCEGFEESDKYVANNNSLKDPVFRMAPTNISEIPAHGSLDHVKKVHLCICSSSRRCCWNELLTSWKRCTERHITTRSGGLLAGEWRTLGFSAKHQERSCPCPFHSAGHHSETSCRHRRSALQRPPEPRTDPCALQLPCPQQHDGD